MLHSRFSRELAPASLNPAATSCIGNSGGSDVDSMLHSRPATPPATCQTPSTAVAGGSGQVVKLGLASIKRAIMSQKGKVYRNRSMPELEATHRPLVEAAAPFNGPTVLGGRWV